MGRIEVRAKDGVLARRRRHGHIARQSLACTKLRGRRTGREWLSHHQRIQRQPGIRDERGSLRHVERHVRGDGQLEPSPRALLDDGASSDGRVVAIGGLSAAGLLVRANAEIYDPSTGKWTLSGALVEPRFGQAQLFVPSIGKVLLGGGKTTGPNGDVFRATLEWFDPATGTFTHAADLAEANSATVRRRRSFRTVA